MRANHELTQRFTAEFSIRPMLILAETERFSDSRSGPRTPIRM
ncbi:MAG: hypothetical protein R3B96_17830 [Pirellulaceae bacterium]